MNDSIRALNDAELGQVAGGMGIGGGNGQMPVVGVGGGGRDFAAPGTGDNPYGGLDPIVSPKGPILGGGSWWIIPGDLNPVIPVPKPDPGKP